MKNFIFGIVVVAFFGIFGSLESARADHAGRIRKKDMLYYKKTVFKPDSNRTFHENRCKGLEDLLAGRDECKFDPDEILDVPQIIRRHGYPSETHVIETEDGYLLKVHRIPGDQNGAKGRQPAFLQHGLLGSSADWVLNGNTTLAFYLADMGYDVWLGNARGNVYSRAHVSLPLSSSQFWNFSWHEMATKDLPAVIYHISNITDKPGEIIYIGHSMGTTMSFVLASTLPQVVKNLKVIVSLAPVVYMKNLRSPLKILAPYADDIRWIASHLGINALTPSNNLLRLLSYGCEKRNEKKKCENLLFLIAGLKDFDMSMLPKISGHDPAGASTKTLVHYAQEIQNGGNFQQYDYGPNGNMEKYGTLNPPWYKLTNIKKPLYLMYAKNDILTSNIDVKRLSKKITNLAGLYKVPGNTFGHLDFTFGTNAFKYVYKPLVKFLKKYKTDYDINSM